MGTQYAMDVATGILMVSDKAGLTPEGGVAVKLTNKTSANSVKGMLVEASSTTDNAFQIAAADGIHMIGAVYENGVADGSGCWVVISGVAQVLLKDSTAATRGYWATMSDTAGRADATNVAAPGGGIVELDAHMQEIGHVLETQIGGTDVLCRIAMHFN